MVKFNRGDCCEFEQVNWFKFKKLRVKQGLTQDELAQALFVTRQTVSNYETGRSNPDVDMLQRISEVLHTDINYLLYGDLLFAERRLLRKRTFKIITVFCAFLILMLVFYPLTLSLKTNKYEFMPYMLVRMLLVPSFMLVLGLTLLQTIEYVFRIKRIDKPFIKWGRIAVCSILIINFAIVLPYITGMMVGIIQEYILNYSSISMTIPHIPVYGEIAYFFLNVMYNMPFVYVFAGFCLWLFFPPKNVK